MAKCNQLTSLPLKGLSIFIHCLCTVHHCFDS